MTNNQANTHQTMDHVVRALKPFLLKAFTLNGLTEPEMFSMFDVITSHGFTYDQYRNYCDTVVFDIEHDSYEIIIEKINAF